MQDKNELILEASKELILREIKLCKNLRAMISRELEAIVLDGDMDKLFKIFEEKDLIISQLQLLADSWNDILSELDLSNSGDFVGQILKVFPDDEELRDLVRQTHEIASSIMKAEDEAMIELEKHASGHRSKMAARVQAKRAAASYARMGGSII